MELPAHIAKLVEMHKNTKARMHNILVDWQSSVIYVVDECIAASFILANHLILHNNNPALDRFCAD